MAESSSSTRSSRSSSSRSNTRTSTRSASATTTFTGVTSDSGVFTFVPTSTPTQTALVTQPAPSGSSSTTLVSSPTSTPVADASNGLSPKVVISLVLIIGFLVIGIGMFLAVFFMRKRAGRPLFSKSRSEPKHRDSHLQPALPSSSIYLPSKERDFDVDTIAKSHNSSLDSDGILSPKSKVRSSRASSSIFADDDATVASRPYLRPLSMGESTSSLSFRSMQMANGSSAQLLSSSERRNSNVVYAEPPRQLSPIPGTPATPGITFLPAEPSQGHDEESGLMEPSQILTVARESRYSKPPTPASALGPLPPVPTISYPFDHRRNSTNTLAPSRYGPPIADSRPQSMVSVYSTQTQNLPMELPENLSPDVLATLERLHQRTSTAWSVNSVDTYRFNKSNAALTEEG